MTCLANHIRDGFGKQQMTSVTLPAIQLTTVVMESIFITSTLLLFTKNIMWIIRREQNKAGCLLSWDLVTGRIRITLEWPPISWRRCSSPCTIQYVDSVTCCDSCAWRPSRTQWRRGRTHSARDKGADRVCKKYILPRPICTAFPYLLMCSYSSLHLYPWNTELLWILYWTTSIHQPTNARIISLLSTRSTPGHCSTTWYAATTPRLQIRIELWIL